MGASAFERQIRDLVRDAADDRPWRRRQAINGIGNLGARTPVGSTERAQAREILVAGLADAAHAVRYRALRGLRLLGEPEPAVLALARHENPRFRGIALETLAWLGEPWTALATLEPVLMAEEDDVVRTRGLAGIAHRAREDPDMRDLALAMGHHWSTQGSRAAWALDLFRLLRVPGEPERCLALLEHPDVYVRWYALRLLRRYPEHDDVSLRHLDDDNPFLRRQATITLGRRWHKPGVVDRLAELLGDEDTWVRHHAIDALARIGIRQQLAGIHSEAADAAEAVLRTALRSPHPEVRGTAAWWLRPTLREDLDAGVALLDDPHPQVVWGALQLVHSGARRHERLPLPLGSPVVAALARVLAGPLSAEARMAGVMVLRLVAPPRRDGGPARTDLAPVLAAALTESDIASYQDTARPSALLRLLGHCADPAVVPAIEDWWERVRASTWSSACALEVKDTLDVLRPGGSERD